MAARDPRERPAAPSSLCGDGELTDSAEVDLKDLAGFLRSVPAAHAVYLMRDGVGRPVQLLCVRNLRASLKRRLSEADPDEPSRRVDYRELVRDVAWRRVDSALEADLVYLETARRCFPDTYAGLLGFRAAWWVHVNPKTRYPRFTKTNEPALSTGRYFGPLAEKGEAQKLVHAVEEMFDLCRDYTYLQNAPAAACTWKQMGKCVGPCDGTVSLKEYGQVVQRAADALGDPDSAAFALGLEMRELAGALKFEEAGRLKAKAAKLADLRKGGRKHVATLADYGWVVVAPGPRAGSAKLLVATPRAFGLAACVVDELAKPATLLRHLLAVAEDRDRPSEAAHVERIGLLTHHLFQPAKKQECVILRADTLTEKTLRAAVRKVAAREVAAVIDEDEGVTKELG